MPTTAEIRAALAAHVAGNTDSDWDVAGDVACLFVPADSPEHDAVADAVHDVIVADREVMP